MHPYFYMNISVKKVRVIVEVLWYYYYEEYDHPAAAAAAAAAASMQTYQLSQMMDGGKPGDWTIGLTWLTTGAASRVTPW